MSLPLIVPPLLKATDQAIVVAPSSPAGDSSAGISLWQAWGLTIDSLTLPTLDENLGYLAGDDTSRLATLQAALDSPNCAAILCARGGYGATRLLDHLNWQGFRQHPKWLVGFSDTTALLWAALKAGVASLHAPLLSTLPHEPEASLSHLHRLLFDGTVTPLPGEVWQAGTAVGRLLPANLTVATALLGTPHWPHWSEPVILALEDINEEAYRLDRMLTQWRQAGALANVAGIALGRFSWTESETEPDDPLPTLRDRLLDLKIPVIANLPFGHAGANYALPVGVWAHLEGGCLNCKLF